MNNFLYPTFAKAMQATIVLGITSWDEYQHRYKEDPHLPAHPRHFYSEEWLSMGGEFVFFGKKAKNFYPTFSEAQQATSALGITSRTEYQQRYKEDSRLSASPHRVYSKEWLSMGGESAFFGNRIRNFYPTLAEAQQATRALGITSRAEYQQRYKEDLRLPAIPHRVYSEEWPSKGGGSVFFGNRIRNFYPTLAEAQQATIALGITTKTEYLKRYKASHNSIGYYLHIRI